MSRSKGKRAQLLPIQLKTSDLVVVGLMGDQEIGADAQLALP
jgi:hypothetical protein